MLGFCRPDIVLRPFVTQQFAQRPAPYRGLDGIRDYGERHNVAHVSDLVGTVDTHEHERRSLKYEV